MCEGKSIAWLRISPKPNLVWIRRDRNAVEMEPFSQAARRFEWLSNFELSHAQLPEIAASGNETSPEVILAANKPLAQPLVTTASTMVLKARSPDQRVARKRP